MSIALSELTEALETEVPVQNEIPTERQYQNAVESAVRDFSRRAANRKWVTISIVPGTAEYQLPADFLSDISLDPVHHHENTIVPNAGLLIPADHVFDGEQYTIVGKKLIFYPTPRYTLERVLWYRAGHVLMETTEGDVYPDMTDEIADIVLIKARANCYRYLSQSAAPDGWRYSIGDVTVDKSKKVDALKGAAAELDGEYLQRVEEYIGAIGMAAEITGGITA